MEEISINRYIYKLTLSNGCTYIGQRWFKSSLPALEDTYTGSSSYIKYHKELTIVNREILIEKVQDDETLNFLETWCILSDKAYNNAHNVNGNYGNWILKFSGPLLDSTKKKIGDANRGNKLSEDTIKRRTKTRYERDNYKQTDVSKKIRSEKMKGHPNWNYKDPWNKGLKNCFNSETLIKMSKSKVGIFDGVNNPFYGKKHTEDAIERNRLAHIGKIPWNKNKKQSQDVNNHLTDIRHKKSIIYQAMLNNGTWSKENNGWKRFLKWYTEQQKQ